MKIAPLLLVPCLLAVACTATRRHSYYGGLREAAYEPQVSFEVIESIPASDFAAVMKTPAQIAIGYPTHLLPARLTGEVLAIIIIEADGTVGTVAVKSASYPDFAQWLQLRASYCSFLPAKQDGRAIRSSALCKVTFAVIEQ